MCHFDSELQFSVNSKTMHKEAIQSISACFSHHGQGHYSMAAYFDHIKLLILSDSICMAC